MNPDDLRKADAIEVVIGQGAKPGGGGMLLGQKISERVAEMRTLPEGIDQRSASPASGLDRAGRSRDQARTNCAKSPIGRSRSTSRSAHRVPITTSRLRSKPAPTPIVLDGMQGGTAATQDVFIEHVGIPTLAAIPPAVQALQDLGMHRKVQLIVSGGVRTGADVAKCLALGADAVSIGTAALVAHRRQRSASTRTNIASSAPGPGAYDDWHEGRDPAGITTQDEALARGSIR